MFIIRAISSQEENSQQWKSTIVDDSVLGIMDSLIEAVVDNNMDVDKTEIDSKDEAIKAIALTIEDQAKRINNMESNFAKLLQYKEEDIKEKETKSNSVGRINHFLSTLIQFKESILKIFVGLKWNVMAILEGLFKLLYHYSYLQD